MQGRFPVIRWTSGRVAHLARHGVSPEEADEVLADFDGDLRRGRDGRFLLYGRTEAGRMLLLVLVDEGNGIAGLITGRDVTSAERRRFFG